METYTLIAPEGSQHVGCPDCGAVTTVPSDVPEDRPWCVHANGVVKWKAGGPESGWSKMVPVSVSTS